MSVANDHDIRAAVMGYIRENLLYARPDFPLGEEDSLLDEGIVDSMGAVELVAFLQDHFGIVVPDDEITEDNFGSVAAIAAFVGDRRRSAA